MRTLTILNPNSAKPEALMRAATYLVRFGNLSQLSVNTDRKMESFCLYINL